MDTVAEFDTNSLASFREAGLTALHEFRAAASRRVHRGEIGKNVLWSPSGELHLYDDERNGWFSMGQVKKSDGPSGWHFFEPSPITAPFREAETFADMGGADEWWLLGHSSQFWQRVVDTWNWGRTLGTLIMEIGDMLPEES